MKAMMLTGLRQMELRVLPDPEIVNPDDVMIRMLVSGVCGSDIHYYTQGQIGSQVVSYPFSVGHEGSGVVVKTGSAVSSVKPGDVIAIEPAMPCHECDQCLSGRQHTCRKIRFLGCPGQAEGCLREYIILPESSCIPLPSELGPDHGAISEPLAIGVYSVKKAGKTAGLDTGILGFGPIGMSVMLALKAAGTGRIMVSEKIDERLVIAGKEGADVLINPLRESVRERVHGEAPLGLDIVFECCGQQETMDEAVKILKPGGKLVVVGIPEFENWSVNVEDTRRKEISIQFIRRQVDCVEAAIELMRSGKADTGNMVTHRFRLEEAKEAFDMVAAYRDGVMKAMIDF